MDFAEPIEPRSEYPGRLKRLPELFDWLSPLYFITFNTRLRTPILARDEVHTAFIEFCRRADQHDIRVGEYVLMPDHVHLLVAMPKIGGPTLSHWIGSLKNVLGKTLLSLGRGKPPWQEGFFDHVIRSEASYKDKLVYIRQNPVEAGLCKTPAK